MESVAEAISSVLPPPPQPTRNIEKDTVNMLCFKYFVVYIVILENLNFVMQ
jgi:hypothetical protein